MVRFGKDSTRATKQERLEMVEWVIKRAEKYAHSRMKVNKKPVSKKRKKAETYIPVKPCRYGHRERYVKGHQNCVK